jgi:hypothetical protein
MPTIAELTTELVTLVQTLPAFTNKGFSVYDIDDLQSVANLESPPLVGVAYEGGGFADNVGNPVGQTTHAAALFRAQFSVIIAVAYETADAPIDNKPSATTLLDEIRSTVLGYKSVNTRPWRFMGEAPMPGKLEGVIFYGQMWETDITVLRNTN